MKKINLFACILLISMQINAQQTFVWDYYKIQITVPDDFKVMTNNNTEFEMKGDGMELYMNIFEENISIDDLDKVTVMGAKAMELTEVDEATRVKVNELQGFYVEGYKSGHRVMYAGLGDPNTATNFFLVITFLDNDKIAEKAALDILNSLDVL